MTELQPATHAASDPERPAVVMTGSGDTITYGELEATSNRLARLLRERGLEQQDHLAVFLPNDLAYFEVVWAGLRAGLYVTPINWHLGPEEAGYIVENCEAKALITHAEFADTVAAMDGHLGAVDVRLVVGGELAGFESYPEAAADLADTPIDDEVEGAYMFYSSGTTGRPKGIMPTWTGQPVGSGSQFDGLTQLLYGFGPDTRYLCPAPLYHAAPIAWSISTLRLGGTVFCMERFDPVAALRAIDEHGITKAQFVPTHFVRMLKLPAEEREGFDLSSLQTAVHAAAPCPVDVKQAMLDWWGPVIYEYYSGSEGGGFCAIGPEEWLEHPGSVGKNMLGPIHIVGEDGDELGPGETGQVWFEAPARFEYHGDPEKTAAAHDDRGWTTLGDIGHVDEDGYLYLTDRASHMIISGGVNIYPQEVENLLTLHPDVADVAVIGVPDDEMGEQVKAVVQPADPSAAGDQLAERLIAHCREHLAHYKCPRTVDFRDELPRLPTGKLLKRKLRDEYGA